MALQDILKKILEEAEASVKSIESGVDSDKKRLAADSAVIEKQALQNFEAKTEQALLAVNEKTSAMARQENAKAMAQAKREVMEIALNKFLAHLVALEEVGYTKVLEALLAPLKGESGTLLTAPSRVALTEKVAGKDFTVKADESIAGGFIFQSGSSEVDNSFQNLIFSEFRDALEMYFAENLKLV